MKIPPEVGTYLLGEGEAEVLAHAAINKGSGAILDDRAARRAAAFLDIPHIGTLGVVVLAKKKGVLEAARPVLEEMRKSGMYLSERAMNQALSRIGE